MPKFFLGRPALYSAWLLPAPSHSGHSERRTGFSGRLCATPSVRRGSLTARGVTPASCRAHPRLLRQPGFDGDPRNAARLICDDTAECAPLVWAAGPAIAAA
jgi:hypothetical protein